MKVSPIYTSSLLKKGLKLASENSVLFIAGTEFLLSNIARPVSILATPKTNKDDKKYAAAKSISSSIVKLGVSFLITSPIAKAIKKIDKNPKNFLSEETIKNLQEQNKNITSSKKYTALTQLLKMSVGFLVIAPKQFLTSILIPPVLKNLFPKKKEKTRTSAKNHIISMNEFKKSNKNITFEGNYTDILSKKIGNLINSKKIQDFSQKISKTKFEQHIISLTDILSTIIFAFMAKNNKKIEEKRKKPLIINSFLSTGLCISSGYAVNKLLDKPTEKFVKKFSEINKDSPDLIKYQQGIKVVKPALVFGLIYYTLIPVVSTFLSDKIGKSNINNAKKPE